MLSEGEEGGAGAAAAQERGGLALRSTVDACVVRCVVRPSVRGRQRPPRARRVRCLLSAGRGAHVPTRDLGITYSMQDELNGGNWFAFLNMSMWRVYVCSSFINFENLRMHIQFEYNVHLTSRSTPKNGITWLHTM